MPKPQASPTLRRNPFGLGLLLFYLGMLAGLAYVLHSLYGRVLQSIP